MSESSSSKIAASTKYIDQSWLNIDEIGKVQVRSCRVSSALGLGVHHCIVINGVDDKWRVFQWGNGGTNGWKNFSSYACEKIYGNTCISDLGYHKVSDVYEAAKNASYGCSYGTSYNCNKWTQRVARYLGSNIEVHWNCSCVL